MQIRDTHFLTHRDTGKLKGVFVEFDSKENLQSALQLNGQVSLVDAVCTLLCSDIAILSTIMLHISLLRRVCWVALSG